MTDAEIIERSCQNSSLFEEIFDRHFKTIYGYLHRRLGKALADDLAAETFTVAFANRERYNREYLSARPWLFGIANNLARSHRRSEEQRLHAHAAGASDRHQWDLEDRYERIDAIKLAPQLSKALVALRPRDREALLLYALAGLSYQEVADALGLTRGDVGKRLNRARKKATEILGPVMAESELS